MSSKLSLQLINPFKDLHVTQIDDETKEIPAHHPFKYCLRFKNASAQINIKPSLDNKLAKDDKFPKEASTKIPLHTEDNTHKLNAVQVQVQEVENSTKQQYITKTSADLKVQSNSDDSVNSNLTVNTLKKSLNQNREYARNKQISPKYCSPNSSISSPKLTQSLPTQLKKSTIAPSASSLKTCEKKQQTKPPVWKSSTLKSFITSGVGKKNQQTPQFAYDLSRDELKSMGSLKGPMKTPNEQELKLLKTGQRLEYLTQRYSKGPECKYNYPEATSWRIGWLHNQRN